MYGQNLPRRKRAKKGGDASKALGEQTRDLIAILKSCLNHGSSLEDIWSALQTSVAQIEEARPKKERPKKKVPKGQSKGKKLHPEGKPQEVQWWTDNSGIKHAYTTDSSGWWSWVPNPNRQNQKPAEAHIPARQVHAAPPQPRRGAWISAVRTTDWGASPVPKLISFPRLKENLKLGQELEGNLIEVWDPAALDELHTLWTCFDKKDGLTALLLGNAKKQSTAATSARLSVTRGSEGQKLEEVSLLRIGSGNGPWLPQSTKVHIRDFPAVQRETLRIAAPSFYCAQFIGDRNRDSPTLVIQALAEITNLPVQEFLGGRWNEQEAKAGKQFVSFLRLKASTVAALMPLSGKCGLFFTHVNPKDKGDFQPWWVLRNAQESDETYFRRVCKLQKDREEQPMLFRFGPGANLGFKKRAEDTVAAKVRLHTAQGIPRGWGNDDFEHFLTAQKWTEVSELNRKRNCWTCLAKAPSDSSQKASWLYDIGDENTTTWNISIQVAVRGPRTPKTEVVVKGPRKSFLLKDFWPNEQNDAKSTEEPQSPSRGRSTARQDQDRTRSRTPKKTAEAEVTQLDPPTQAMEGQSEEQPVPKKKARVTEPSDPAEATATFGWRRWDQKGNGDCFFRCVSVFLDPKLTTQPAEADSARQAAWIRAEFCQHIKKHSARFAELFDGDKAFQDWRKNIAQPTTWAEGKAIQAASEKIGTPIVIWAKQGEVFTRFVVAPKFKHGFACGSSKCTPICVWLEGQHFTALVPPPQSVVPRSWLRETPDVVIDLTGGGPGVTASQESCCVPLPPTPSVHTLVSGCDSSSVGPSGDSAPACLGSTLSVHPLAARSSLPTPSVQSLCEPSAARSQSASASSGHLPVRQRLFTKSTPAPVSGPPRSNSTGKVRLYGKQSVSDHQSICPLSDHDMSCDEMPENHEEKVWTCNLCNTRFNAPSGRKLCELRSRHLISRHPDRDRTVDTSIRKRVVVITPTHMIPFHERSWSCPWCRKGLPCLSKWQRGASIKAHYKNEHPEQDTSYAAVLKARWDCYRKNPSEDPILHEAKKKMVNRMRQRHDLKRNQDSGKDGHSYVWFQPDWNEVGQA
eukprot:Skav219682  [mRNA]  locus=scaffold817:68613:71852:- [translate_table: standard]